MTDKTKLTKDEESAIVLGYEEKTSITTLADQYKVSRSTIRRVLNEAGVFTKDQIDRSKGALADKLIARYGLNLEKVTSLFRVMHDLDLFKQGENGTEIHIYGRMLTRENIVKHLMDMEEGTWQALLNEVVSARVAKAHNTHTISAMLRLQEKVEKNARDSKPDGE
jgi:hypothetical protein